MTTVATAIALHFAIGLGGLACGVCGRKVCRHRWQIIIATITFLLIEATASVIIIDNLIGH